MEIKFSLCVIAIYVAPPKAGEIGVKISAVTFYLNSKTNLRPKIRVSQEKGKMSDGTPRIP